MVSYQSNINFIAEQNGNVEQKFKEKITTFLSKVSPSTRAYLCRVSYSYRIDPENFGVALCILTESDMDMQDAIRAGVSSIFHEMFSNHEHLDIIFLDEVLEAEIRKVCRPFVFTGDFDFVLASSEGYELEDPRTCVSKQWFDGDHRDGYLLVSVNPPIIGQKFGLGGQDIYEVVLAARHRGCSLNPVAEWPTAVHVALPSTDFRAKSNRVRKGDLHLIGWGEIYKTLDDVPSWFVGRA